MVVTLNPNESVTAVLSATRGQLKVRVTYVATLSGMAAVNYGHTYKGHHFWGLDIYAVMSSAKLPLSITITEDITIGYYSDATITLKDSEHQVLMVTPASATPGQNAAD